MSSVYVRTQIKNFIAAEAPSEKVIDMTSRFEELPDLIKEAGLTTDDPWLGLDFIGDDEIPITVPATNTSGKYRETGAIFFHIVECSRLGGGNAILARGETLRALFRGRRIGDVVIKTVTPVNTSSGATLQFEGGYSSGSFICDYERDLDL